MTENYLGPTVVGSFDCFGEVWTECLRRIMESGRDVRDGDTQLRELLNVSLSATRCCADEFIDLGASADRIELMHRKYHSLETVPPYTFSYGSLFRQHEGVDQIAWLISHLREKPETKSATIGFHRPGSADLSCVSLLDCKIRSHALHMNVVFRSQNVFDSQPGNVLALAKFQLEIANALGVAVGQLTLHVLSAHIYHQDFARVKDILNHHDQQCRNFTEEAR